MGLISLSGFSMKFRIILMHTKDPISKDTTMLMISLSLYEKYGIITFEECPISKNGEVQTTLGFLQYFGLLEQDSQLFLSDVNACYSRHLIINLSQQLHLPHQSCVTVRKGVLRKMFQCYAPSLPRFRHFIVNFKHFSALFKRPVIAAQSNQHLLLEDLDTLLTSWSKLVLYDNFLLHTIPRLPL